MLKEIRLAGSVRTPFGSFLRRFRRCLGSRARQSCGGAVRREAGGRTNNDGRGPTNAPLRESCGTGLQGIIRRNTAHPAARLKGVTLVDEVLLQLLLSLTIDFESVGGVRLRQRIKRRSRQP